MRTLLSKLWLNCGLVLAGGSGGVVIKDNDFVFSEKGDEHK